MWYFIGLLQFPSKAFLQTSFPQKPQKKVTVAVVWRYLADFVLEVSWSWIQTKQAAFFNFIESWDNRMVWIGKELKDHLVPTPCHGLGHLSLSQVDQSPIQHPGMWHPQLFWATTSSASLPSPQRSLNLFYLDPITPCPITAVLEEESLSTILTAPPSSTGRLLLLARLNTLNSLSLPDRFVFLCLGKCNKNVIKESTCVVWDAAGSYRHSSLESVIFSCVRDGVWVLFSPTRGGRMEHPTARSSKGCLPMPEVLCFSICAPGKTRSINDTEVY